MKEMGRIHSISISPERGQLKKEVTEATFIEGFGIENDGHAGDWGRQVTCLSMKVRRRLPRSPAFKMGPGDFAENLLIAEFDLSRLTAGDRLKIAGDVVLQITQIGKEDHPSIVSRTFGISLLPSEGLFCRVIKGGKINKGDKVEKL